jgi:hypothetical protein
LFEVISRSASDRSRNPCPIQLATSGLIQHLKLLVKIGIEDSVSPQRFLDAMTPDDFTVDLDHYKTQMPALLNRHADKCFECNAAVVNDCFQDIGVSQIWHVECQIPPFSSSDPAEQPFLTCLACGVNLSPTIRRVTVLQQYRHLLWVALARLMTTLNMNFDVLHGISLDREATYDEHEGVTQREEPRRNTQPLLSNSPRHDVQLVIIQPGSVGTVSRAEFGYVQTDE